MPNMKMIRTTISTLALTYLLLACGQTPNPTTKPTDPQTTTQKIFGTAELMVGDGILTSDLPTITPKGAINESGVQFSRLVSSGATDSATERYVWATYEFKNITTGNLTNLSLYAYNQIANNAAGTAFKAVRRLDNTPITDTNVIRGIQPSAGLILNAGVFNVNPAEADLQVFRSSEASAVDVGAKVLGSLLPNDTILEYGYTIRSASGDRTLTPNELGVVTLGFRVPLQTVVTDTPRRFTTTFTYATDAVTRVTRDKSETTAQVVARTGAPVNATEVALVGTDTDIAGNGLATVRLLRIKTFTDPSSAPVTVGSTGGTVSLGQARIDVPAGAITGSASFAITQLNTTPLPLPQGFEMARASGSAVVSAYRVSASQGSFNSQQISISVPVDVPINPPGTPMITELYVYDGQTFTKMQIESAPLSFQYYTYSLDGSSSGITPSYLDFFVFRATLVSISSACTSTGGTFNGKYCEKSFPAALLGSSTRSEPVARRFLSINVGNADLGHCGNYLVKLCSYAVEERVRNILRGLSPLPNIIAMQEVWHDDCTYINDLGSKDRVCADPPQPPLRKAKQIERLIDTTIYDYRCSPKVVFSGEADVRKKVVNGFECVAINKALFEFTTPAGSSPATLQPACGTPTAGQYYEGSDTGFQIERVRLKSPVYRDPINSTDLTAALQAVTFDIANGHLIAINKTLCRQQQLALLGSKYFDTRPAFLRPLSQRLLVAGDLNTDILENSIAGDQFKANFSDLNTSVNAAVGIGMPSNILPPTRIGYLLSDPRQATAFFGPITVGSLDHVASNFSDGTCVRLPPIIGLDHIPTSCLLTGFDAGFARALIQSNQIVGGVLTQVPELNFIVGRRRGVALTYVRLASYNAASGLHTLAGLPTTGPLQVEFRRCQVTGVYDREVSAEVSPGTGFAFGVLTYPSAAFCN